MIQPVIFIKTVVRDPIPLADTMKHMIRETPAANARDDWLRDLVLGFADPWPGNGKYHR